MPTLATSLLSSQDFLSLNFCFPGRFVLFMLLQRLGLERMPFLGVSIVSAHSSIN